MRRFALIMALSIVALSAMAQHPQDGVARHMVTFNVYATAFGIPTVGYEYRIGDRSAVDVDLGFIIVSRKYEHIRAHGIFSQLQYRVYPWKQRRSQPRPFVGLGLNCVYGWKDVNLMTGNRGWEIEKETILLRQWRLRPSLMIGLKVNIPFGLTFEATAGVLLAKHDDGRLIYHNLDMVNYVATQITIRVGWSFDGKRHTKAVEPPEEPAVEMEN